MALLGRGGSQFRRVRALGTPDWNRIGSQAGEEERMGAENGWFIGSAGGSDHPCTVFLTNSAIYIDVRPDTDITGRNRQQIRISPDAIQRSGLGLSDQRNPRFVVVYNNGGVATAFGVDFAPKHQQFASALAAWASTS